MYKIGQSVPQEGGLTKIEYLKGRDNREKKFKDKLKAIQWLRSNGFDMDLDTLNQTFSFEQVR